MVFEGLDDEQSALRAMFRYAARDLATHSGGRLMVRPPDDVTSVLPTVEAATRDQVLWLEYPRNLSLQTRFRIPTGFRIASQPSHVTVEIPGFRYRSMWLEDTGAGDLVWSAQLTIQDTKVEPTEYPQVRDFVARVREALREFFVLEATEPSRVGGVDAHE